MRIDSTFLRRIACILTICLVIVAVPVPSHAATISELENEKKELEQKKKEAEKEKESQQAAYNSANEKAEGLAENLGEIEGEMEEVDQALVETLASIDMINEDIEDKKEEIKVTTKQYEEAKAIEQEQYDSMKMRIKFLYEKGDLTYMQLLVEARNFSDLMNRAEYIEKLYDYDRKMLLEYQETKEETLAVKEQLEEEKEELDATKLELKEEEDYLNDILAQKEAEYEDYSNQLSKAKAEAAAYKSNIEKKNSEIKKLQQQADEKQKQINKAIEEQNKPATSTGASSSSPQGGSKSYSPANSFASGSVGERMVQYALQFVGNPYVYGGTSLTQGADCSGFIFRIYRDFGYTIPRAGTSMRTVGTEVSYENARAGDIVCYPGHVALYMGNGKIVHASTERTGIKTGNVFYKQFITIRRVV